MVLLDLFKYGTSMKIQIQQKLAQRTYISAILNINQSQSMIKVNLNEVKHKSHINETRIYSNA